MQAFDRFVEHLSCQNHHTSPLPANLLPSDAKMDDSQIRDLRYSVPNDTDFKKWVAEYGKNTEAKFNLQVSDGPAEEKETYRCDILSCGGRILIMPKEQGPDENTRTTQIEIVGHTKHPKGIVYESRELLVWSKNRGVKRRRKF